MRSKSSKPRDVLPRWHVYQIRKRAELIGSVLAASEAEALERAVEQYEIRDREKQKRLFVRPT